MRFSWVATAVGVALLFTSQALAATLCYVVSGTLGLKTGGDVMGLNGGQLQVEVFTDALQTPHYTSNVSGTLTAHYTSSLARLTLQGTSMDGTYDDPSPGDVIVINQATLKDELDLTALSWSLGANQSCNPVSFVVQMTQASSFPGGSIAQPLFTNSDVNEVFVTFAATDGASTGNYALLPVQASAAAVPEPASLTFLTAGLGITLSARCRARSSRAVAKAGAGAMPD